MLWLRPTLALIAGALGFAQAPAPEMSTKDTPVTFSTRVNLVLVPVVVRDKQGKAIGSLKQEDFQLFDKGKAQVITRFSVEKAGVPTPVAQPSPPQIPADQPDNGPPPPPAPEHFIAYLFDDAHLNAGDLGQVRNAVTKNLAQVMDATTRAAVYTTSGQVTQDFTDDRDALIGTMNRVLPQPRPLVQGQECPDISFYQADLIVNKDDQQALAAAVAEAMTCVTAPDQQTAQAIAEPLARASAMRALSVGEAETHVSLTVIRDVVRRMTAMPGSRSIVLFSPGFFLSVDERPEEMDLLDRAARGNVTISALDARGVYTVVPGIDVSQRGILVPGTEIKMQYQVSAASADSDIMAELADGTGGSFFRNDNGLAEGFKQLASRPEYVYLLGFSPQNLKLDGGFHGLRVAVKNSKEFNLQARRGYYAPKHLVDPEEQAKEEISEAVFSREEMSDIPLDVHTQFFKSSDVQANLTVVARLDLKRLRFRKDGDRNDNTLVVVSGLFDRNGNYVSGIRKTVEMRLLDPTLAVVQNSGVTVRTNFDVAPGTYAIRVVVRDSEGQTMAARNGAVQIP